MIGKFFDWLDSIPDETMLRLMLFVLAGCGVLRFVTIL